jgi:hypothetical protein
MPDDRSRDPADQKTDREEVADTKPGTVRLARVADRTYAGWAIPGVFEVEPSRAAGFARFNHLSKLALDAHVRRGSSST